MATQNRNNKPLGERLAELPKNSRRRIERKIEIARMIFSNLGIPTTSFSILGLAVLNSFQTASTVLSTHDPDFELYWWSDIIHAQQIFVACFEESVQVLIGRLTELGVTKPSVELVHAVVLGSLEQLGQSTGELPRAVNVSKDLMPIMMEYATEVFGEEFTDHE